MSTLAHPLVRTASLTALAGLLAGCPVVEPAAPESAAPTPASGVWGLLITDVQANGICAELAPAITGRVVRMDVEAHPSGELVLSMFDLDLYGGHADGQVWADADLSGFGWSWGYDVPVSSHPAELAVEVSEDLEEEAEEARAPSEAPVDGCSGHYEPAAPEDHTEGGESDDDDRPSDFEDWDCDSSDPDPDTEVGIFVSIDAELSSAIAMDGILAVTVSNGYGSCTFEAEFDASHISNEDGEDIDLMANPEDVEPMHPEKAPDPAEDHAD